MQIGIFQDLHANLPAFKKAIEVFSANNCSKIYHLGDLIGIGPHPGEVVDMAISIKELTCIMGNHDYWFAFGLPQPKPSWMSDEEVAHQKWCHGQINETHRPYLQSWKFVETFNIFESRIDFQHYGFDNKLNWFKQLLKEPDGKKLDELFEGTKSEILFYGHDHQASDIMSKRRYVNLGSAGCFNKPKVRLGLLKVGRNNIELEKQSIPYDDEGLMEDFEIRDVPARAFITKNFITRHK